SRFHPDTFLDPSLLLSSILPRKVSDSDREFWCCYLLAVEHGIGSSCIIRMAERESQSCYFW
ncbi:hypothetical protein MKW98_014396, partial [Papaver atlanticum]